MYRTVIYVLVFFWFAAFAMSFFGLMPFAPADLAFSSALILLVSWIVNDLFARVFDAPTNFDSMLITALILTLIITPKATLENFWFLVWVSALAMASKYVIAFHKKHLFNPAALAVVVTALALGQSASWWVGNAAMLPFTLVGGLLVARKIVRLDLIFSFLVVAIFEILAYDLVRGFSPLLGLQAILLHSPIVFFAAIMLTEPLTTPPTRTRRIWYGAIVGALFAPFIRVGALYSTPELALVAGNVFSFLAGPKARYVLTLKERVKIAPGIFDFVFTADRPLAYRPGQYLEWTLAHQNADRRGIRRYFTLASSPTEKEARLGVRFYADQSTYKKNLFALEPGRKIVAAALAGDFTLPKNKKQKLAFMAGGIGITPFRSMIKYLLDQDEPRPITLFYSCKNIDEVVYEEVFDEAERKLGIRTIYTLTDAETIPNGWRGEVGRADEAMIRREIPDFRERLFYLSGPRSMVCAFETLLHNLEVKRSRIKVDYFPGFA